MQSDVVKQAVVGRWGEVFRNFTPELSEALDAGSQRHVHCPLPEHEDHKPSFRIDKPDEGRAICSCGSYDGWELLQRLRGWDFPEAVRQVADYLGVNGNGKPKQVNLITAVAQAKRMPVESLRVYGAREAKRGQRPVVRLPVYNSQGDAHSHFDLTPDNNKGWFKSGKGSGGLIFPHDEQGNVRLPNAGDTWLIAPFKDAIALHGLGYLAVGVPDKLPASFAGLFRDTHIIATPDRDESGEDGARVTAARLYNIVASHRIATLPVEYKPSKGFDVRDVLAKPDGDQLLRQAIESASEWQPPHYEDETDAPHIFSPTGQTETANARRLVTTHGDDIRYVDQWGKWLVWDGRRWAIDQQRTMDAFAKGVAGRLWQEAALAAPGTEDKGLLTMLGYCKASNKATGISAMIALARSEHGVPILPSQLDQFPWLLNVLNGTLDLRTQQLKAHDRRDYITKCCPVEYRPNADCPQWLAFLNRIMDSNSKLLTYIRRLVGYCLTGETTEHVLPFLHGDGANGKSTFVNTILSLLGEDYAIKAPPDLLLAKKSAHPTELTDLHGRRFVACIEAEDGRRMAESLVKELTGGDRIRARGMRENFWEFQPTHKIWLVANYKPVIRGQDYGIWRRVKLIPFNVIIPDDEQDKQLPAKLLKELPGILNWALAGCQEWQSIGLKEPTEVTAATNEYKEEMDEVGRFIAESCDVREDRQVGATDIYNAFLAWGGNKHITQHRFGAELRKRGFDNSGRLTAGPNRGRKMWRGIGLLAGENCQE